jgi:adenosylmethionine-8-amino-7-oxononanoate aminotransferase
VILDEVMTGFFRTGAMFAFSKENVRPDLVALAKGLTGGYLPLAATVVDEEITTAFRGAVEKTFYHGHSYSGNQLGCAAALANLDLLQEPSFAPRLQQMESKLRSLSEIFWSHPNVGDVRQEGLILAIELVEDFSSRRQFDRRKRTGFVVSETAKEFGLLTRPIGDVLLIMPPYCTTDEQLEQMVGALSDAIWKILPAPRG